MKSFDLGNTEAAWTHGGETGLRGLAGLEHRRGADKRNRMYLVFQGSPAPAQVLIAHTESKVISNFGHVVISGVLFNQETEDCLEAVTTPLRGWKTKTHIQDVLKHSLKSWNKFKTCRKQQPIANQSHVAATGG